MSDTYQAVYDAVRSRVDRVHSSDVLRVVESAFDMSREKAVLLEVFESAAAALTKPSVLYRPTLTRHGDKWRALYGTDLATGVAGFGETPAAAMAAFDLQWAAHA